MRSAANLPLTFSALAALIGAGCTGYTSDAPSQSCLGAGPDVIQTKCLLCHNSAAAAQGVVPAGAVYETETDIRRLMDAIRTAALVDKTMPPTGALSTCDQEALSAYLDELASQPCTPACDGRVCGSDACGGSCGDCAAGQACNTAGQCMVTVCIPSCSGRACGDDGCGGVCGACSATLTCSVEGACLCTPNCTGRTCGDDGCGGSCGACAGSQLCTIDGTCQCVPSCTGKVCGPDGCGGSCGSCAAPNSCNAAGACVCVPDCSGRTCGPDGCGGSCGTCPARRVCNTQRATGQCACTPSCSGRVCGPDGCGGSCGSCPSGQACGLTGQCGCTPSCSGKTCGSDGCGGVCGTCASTQTCSNDQCVWSRKTFAADVFPIFQAAACAGNACHGGMRPAENLDLSSASVAFSALVNARAGQCGGSKLRVVPGDPAASYLVNKLTGLGMCSGSVMPKTGGELSPTQIDVIRAWIGAGAAP